MRGRFQFHLTTLIVTVLATGVVLLLNMTSFLWRIVLEDATCSETGWPLPSHTYIGGLHVNYTGFNVFVSVLVVLLLAGVTEVIERIRSRNRRNRR